MPSPVKKKTIRLRIKYDKKTIISPTTAAITWFLASSTPPFSPPDVTHLIPPHTKNPKAIIIAIMNANVIIWPNTLPNLAPVSPQIVANCPVPQSTMLSAAACAIGVIVRNPERNVEDVKINFFIILIICRFFLFVKDFMSQRRWRLLKGSSQ